MKVCQHILIEFLINFAKIKRNFVKVFKKIKYDYSHRILKKSDSMKKL